jgi:hypothetical protein
LQDVPPSISQLRQELDQITGLQFPTSYAQALSQLSQNLGRPIRIVPTDMQHLKTFTCFAFALGLARIQRYQDLVRAHLDGALVNSAFVSTLLNGNEIHEINFGALSCDNVVFYFSSGTLMHAGLIISPDGLVRSKWGGNEIHDHGIWDVPASYGDEVRVFEAPEADRVLELLEQHIAAL